MKYIVKDTPENDIDIIKLDPYLSVNGKYTMSLEKGDLIYCTPNKIITDNKILIQHHELLDDKGEFKKLIGTIEHTKNTQDTLILIVQTSPSSHPPKPRYLGAPHPCNNSP
jgi:hypothetical protein